MPEVLDRLRAALTDRYAVERELGRGGMATVYLATDLKHNRPVAVKVLRPELAQSLGSERFLREIQIAAQLNHPHIVPLHDSGEADGFLYYVMPYVQGESLRDLLRRDKQLPIEDALAIAREVADAVAHAHSYGIVHRDLKPENVLLAGGHAVVADFGIARALSAAGGEKLTETGLAIGTPAYMSPEQASGEPELDARSDVYSLGCVLYEMLVGDPPFTGATPQVIMARKSLETVPPLRNVRETVSAALERVVAKALAKMPADRFRTGHEFMLALDRAAKDEGTERGWGMPLWPRRPAQRVLAVGAAVVTLGVAAVVAPRVANNGLFQGAAVAPLRSLAVLPFVNQTGDTGNEYLSDGITEELIGRLARLPGMERVISRASVYTYKGRTVDPRTVAEDLDVGVVVTGTMSRRDTAWALSVEVTDARDDRHLWGDTYELTLDELSSVTDRLAREIPRAIDLDVSDDALTPSTGRTTQDPEAHRFYLRGFQLANRGGDLLQAIEYFERALDRDPGYALAYSGLAMMYSLMALFGHDEPATFYPRAQRAARRALTLGDEIAEAHTAMAGVHLLFEWDWAAAEREYRRALQLDPRNAVVLTEFAWFLTAMDRPDEALAVIEREREVNPVSAGTNHEVAWTYVVAGQNERGVEEFGRVLELFPDYAPAHMVLAWALSRLGRGREAVAAAQQAERLFSRDDPWVLASLGWVYARSGRPDRARENLARLHALAGERYVDPQFIAVLYSGLGETGQALTWLERAFAARSPNLIFKRDGRLWFPELVSDSRYQALRAQMNFPPD